MVRKENGDISDALYKEIFEPFNRYMGLYISENILNEYVAYYVAKAYQTHALSKTNLKFIFSEACEALCQVTAEDCDKDVILQVLKDRHKLEIINENPIDIRELD